MGIVKSGQGWDFVSAEMDFREFEAKIFLCSVIGYFRRRGILNANFEIYWCKCTIMPDRQKNWGRLQAANSSPSGLDTPINPRGGAPLMNPHPG